MRTLLVVVSLIAVAALSAAAIAGSRPEDVDMPTGYGIAQRGSLKVVSMVRVELKGGEMKGVWTDQKVGCLDRRRLTVTMQIDLVSSSGRTTRTKKERTAAVDNCAEGGPNFGFDLKPAAYGMGCRDGRWKPGRYSMTTKTQDPRSGLIAQASLYHQVTRVC